MGTLLQFVCRLLVFFFTIQVVGFCVYFSDTCHCSRSGTLQVCTLLEHSPVANFLLCALPTAFSSFGYMHTSASLSGVSRHRHITRQVYRTPVIHLSLHRLIRLSPLVQSIYVFFVLCLSYQVSLILIIFLGH